jgi:hypothetical protein
VGVALSICTDAPYAALKDSLNQYRIVKPAVAVARLTEQS